MIDKNGTLWVDNTVLRAANTCDLQALLRHGFGFVEPEGHAAAQAGTSLHDGQALYYRTGDPELALKAFRASYRPHAKKIDPAGRQAKLSLENTTAIYREWLAQHPIHDSILYNNAGNPVFRIDPELVEIGLQWPLDARCVCGASSKAHKEKSSTCKTYRPRTMFYGRADAIVEHLTSGHWYVNDHKSTGWLTALFVKKFQLGSQMSGYTWAGDKHALGRQVIGAIITAIEFKDLPSSDRKCSEHGMVYAECGPQHAKFETILVDRTPTLLTEWRKTAIELAERYRALLEAYPAYEKDVDLTKVRSRGMFSDEACVWCDFASGFCMRKRPTKELGALYAVEPWRPYDPDDADAAV